MGADIVVVAGELDINVYNQDYYGYSKDSYGELDTSYLKALAGDYLGFAEKSAGNIQLIIGDTFNVNKVGYINSSVGNVDISMLNLGFKAENLNGKVVRSVSLRAIY